MNIKNHMQGIGLEYPFNLGRLVQALEQIGQTDRRIVFRHAPRCGLTTLLVEAVAAWQKERAAMQWAYMGPTRELTESTVRRMNGRDDVPSNAFRVRPVHPGSAMHGAGLDVLIIEPGLQDIDREWFSESLMTRMKTPGSVLIFKPEALASSFDPGQEFFRFEESWA